jgi:hypothetical protein
MILLLLACAPALMEQSPPAPEVAWQRLEASAGFDMLEHAALARTPAGARLLFVDPTPTPGPRTRVYALGRDGDRLVAEPWLRYDQPLLSVGAGDVDDDGVDEIALITPTEVHVLDGATLAERFVFDQPSDVSGEALVLDVDEDDLPEVLMPRGSSEVGGLVGVDGLPLTVPSVNISAIFGLFQLDPEPELELLTAGGVYDPATLALLWRPPGAVVGAMDVDGDGRSEVAAFGESWVGMFNPHTGEALWLVSQPVRTVSWAALGPAGVIMNAGDEQLRLDPSTGETLEVRRGAESPLVEPPLHLAPDLDGDGVGDLVRPGLEVQQWDPATGDVLARAVGMAWTPAVGAVVDLQQDGRAEILVAGRGFGDAPLMTFDAHSGALQDVYLLVGRPSPRLVVAPRAKPLIAVGYGLWEIVETLPGGRLSLATWAPLRARDALAADVDLDGEDDLVFVSDQGRLSWWDGADRQLGLVLPPPASTLADDLDGDGVDELLGLTPTELCAWRLSDGVAIACSPLAGGARLALVDEGSWRRVVVQDGAGTVVLEARLMQAAWQPAAPVRMLGRQPGVLLTAAGRLWSPQPDLLTGFRLGRRTWTFATRGTASEVDGARGWVVASEPDGVAWWRR